MKASVRRPGRVRWPRWLIRLSGFITLAVVVLLAALMPVPQDCAPSPTLHAAKTP